MVQAGHFKISVKWYKQGTIVILITFILCGEDTFQNCNSFMKKKTSDDLNRQWTNTTLKKPDGLSSFTLLTVEMYLQSSEKQTNLSCVFNW